jgi:ribonuclease D
MPQPAEQIVDRPDQLAEICAHLAASPRIGFDTEFVGEDTYRPRLCLLQIATEERLILIDPFTAGPLEPVWNLLVDADKELVVHAGREEVRLCHLFADRRPGRVFDLQVAAGLVGLNYPLGHAALVGQILHVNLSKSETLTEWRDRPLTERQIRYAFDDVRHLLALRHELSRRLERLERLDWAKEEFHRLVSAAIEEDPVVEKWRRLKGLGSLTRRQLAVVREIFHWREQTADRLNRPPRTLCRDDLIIEIARRNPTRPKELDVMRGLPKRDHQAILLAVERGRALPIEQCPAANEREQDPPQVSWLTGLLSAILGQWCREVGLASGLAATAADLKQLVRTHVCPDQPPRPCLLDEGWRALHVRPMLEAVLRGERAVRVARPADATPLELLPPTR